MIDFDIRKVPGQEHEQERETKRLQAIGFSRFRLCEEVMIGPTHRLRIANWLASTGLVPSRWWYPGSRLRAVFLPAENTINSVKRAIKRLLPKVV